MLSLRTSRQGFTLIEVLVSILLLSLVLTGGMQLYFCTNQMLRLDVHKKIATELVNAKLEDLRHLGYYHLPDCDGVYPCTETSSDIKVGGLYSHMDTTINPTGNCKQVDVVITWWGQQIEGIRSVKATTLIAPP